MIYNVAGFVQKDNLAPELQQLSDRNYDRGLFCSEVQHSHLQYHTGQTHAGKEPRPKDTYSYLFNILANKIGFNCMVGKIARCVVY